MENGLEEYFKRFAKEHLEEMDKGLKEIFKQTWEYNEPLFNKVLEIKKFLDSNGQIFDVNLDMPYLFDVEIEDEQPELAFRDEQAILEWIEEEGDPNNWEATGWYKMHLADEFAEMLEGWNWDNLRLESGKILLFSWQGIFNPVFYAVEEDKLTDDILTMWGHKDFADAIVKNKLSTIN